MKAHDGPLNENTRQFLLLPPLFSSSSFNAQVAWCSYTSKLHMKVLSSNLCRKIEFTFIRIFSALPVKFRGITHLKLCQDYFLPHSLRFINQPIMNPTIRNIQTEFPVPLTWALQILQNFAANGSFL